MFCGFEHEHGDTFADTDNMQAEAVHLAVRQHHEPLHRKDQRPA